MERNHVLVMGGSLAGLLAARVLSGHFARVTIVERDVFPADGGQRRGVPQGRHAHGLLFGGSEILENLFPGFRASVGEAGGLTGDVVNDARWFIAGGCLSRFPSGFEGLHVSRPFLEARVRERVLALENVRAEQGREVRQLIHSGGRVTGADLGGETIPADLVVDATGRGSRTPQWLEAMGYERPAEERVEIALSYTTRMFHRRSTDLDGDTAAIIPPDPAGKRGGVILALEGDRWVVTLTGHFGNCAPADLPGFLEYARSLPAPYIHDVIRDAEPVGEPASARFPASLRRRYEKLEKFPEGYLVIGDAISSFNPVYGQGMTVAAKEAVVLGSCLAAGGERLAEGFFPRAAALVDVPWAIAAGNDLRMKEATGRRSPVSRFLNWYMERLHRAAHRDPVPALAFHRVGNLLDPPQSLLHPRVVLRVALGNLFRSEPAVTRTAPYIAAASPRA